MKKSPFNKIVLVIYRQMIVKKKQEVTFWILYSFLITFAVSRLTVYFAPGFNVLRILTTSVHIHHFVPGLIIMALVGLAALNDLHHTKPRLIAAIYGIGLGWVFDEFALWFYLDDDYWVRRSYDAIILVSGLLFSLVYFGKFWRRVSLFAQHFFQKRLAFKNKLSRTKKKTYPSLNPQSSTNKG